jgi:tetratricopeptide (TPR) repeat protein
VSVSQLDSSASPVRLGWFERIQFSWAAKVWLFFGQKAKARACFQELLAKDPANVLALNSLAYDAVTTKHWQQAAGFFERALQQQPAEPNAHFNVAYVLDELNQLDAAERSFRAALALDEKMDRAWYGLALCLIKQRRFEDAKKALKRNTKLQPMSPFGWYQLARVHMECNEPDLALGVIRHLKSFEPKVAAQLVRETGLKLAMD